MLYVVFDTNVIVSAMVSHNPNAATVKVVEAISLGKIVPLYNEEILAEYDDVLHRAKFNLLDRDVSSMIGTIIKLGMLMDRTESKETLVDLSDLVFYEVALSKEGALVVTGNLKHFPQSPIVVTPSELLMIIY
jgi:putative PIN family toxin of toxin-antitoxin system